MPRPLLSTTLWIGLAAAALMTACSANAAPGQAPVALVTPSIDAAQPDRIETATFALG
jgi:hypothetical protein